MDPELPELPDTLHPDLVSLLKDMSNHINALGTRLDALKTSTAELETSTATLKTSTATLKSTVGTLQSDVGELKLQVQNLTEVVCLDPHLAYMLDARKVFREVFQDVLRGMHVPDSLQRYRLAQPFPGNEWDVSAFRRDWHRLTEHDFKRAVEAKLREYNFPTPRLARIGGEEGG